MYLESFTGYLLYNFSIGYGICRCSLICPDQSWNTQLDASEVSYYYNKNITQLVGINLSQDGSARRSGRLSVVICPELISKISKTISIDMMPRVVVLLLESCDDFLYFIFCFNGISMGNESASIVLEQAP